MSALKPLNKRPPSATSTLSPLTRTQSRDDLTSFVEGKSTGTGCQDTSSTPRKTATVKPGHPKGHNVRDLKTDVWGPMDAQAFLRLTDTLSLSDLLIQPICCEPQSGALTNVTMYEFVNAPHPKFRRATHRMATDDLLKLLYLCDSLIRSSAGLEEVKYDDWLNEKIAACVRVKGLDEGNDRGKLCNFIMVEDREFTFYPANLHQKYGVFFRKTCYHSYQTGTKEKEGKLDNPAMIKCCATRGKFEYVLEARLVALPSTWFDAVAKTD